VILVRKQCCQDIHRGYERPHSRKISAQVSADRVSQHVRSDISGEWIIVY